MQKIALNHMQLVALAASFPLQWPPVVESLFATFGVLGDAGGECRTFVVVVWLWCVVLIFVRFPFLQPPVQPPSHLHIVMVRLYFQPCLRPKFPSGEGGEFVFSKAIVGFVNAFDGRRKQWCVLVAG